MPTAYEPKFGPKMRKAFPILRGFESKLRQGIWPIKPQAFEVTEAKREERKAKRKEARAKAASVRAATRRNKRRHIRWWT